MSRKKAPDPDWSALLRPQLALAEASAAMMRRMFDAFAAPPPAPAPQWTSANRVVLELAAARLRCFDAGKPGATPVIVCAPFALHDARLADLCAGHSLMAALAPSGAPLFLVEWTSARPEQAARRIDDLLADLNVFVDEVGGVADLVGLCQGGWLSLAYAARFPGKARKLVLAGAPVDIAAQPSSLSMLAQSTPMESYRQLVAFGGGLARGADALKLWRQRAPDPVEAILQLSPDDAGFAESAARFLAWDAHVLDLPGAYYLEVVETFYRRNALARGEFSALGRVLDLSGVRTPLYLIAARDDEVTAPGQCFACAGLVGTPARAIRRKLVEGCHLSLFVGAQNLRNAWRDVAAFLG